MKLTIGHKGMIVFAKTMRFMAKYSNDLIIEAQPDQLVLKVVNSPQTALIQSNFEDVFFVRYERGECDEDNCIRVPFRPLLNCVKNCKHISGCLISLDATRDHMILTLKKESGIETVHKIYLLESEEIESLVQDQNLSEVTCHPSIFKRLQGSNNEIRELHLQFNQKSVLVENFIESDEDCRTVRLHYLINSNELQVYELKREVSIVFAWPDFNYIVDMAQQINCDLRIRFSKTGKPLIVILDTGASYTVQLVVMTLSNEFTKKRKCDQKVVTYREMMNEYVDENNLNIEGSQLERVLSPNIYASNSEVSRDKITPNITEKDLDDIAATLARKNNEKSFKKPENVKEVNPNNTIMQLSQFEQDECENIIRDAALFDDEMEVDLPLFEPPKRITEHSFNLESYRLQASKQNLLDMQRVSEEPQSEELMEEIESHNIVPSDPKPMQTEGYKLSTQEKREMKNIKKIFTSGRSQLAKLKEAKDLCPGSDSEESYIDE